MVRHEGEPIVFPGKKLTTESTEARRKREDRTECAGNVVPQRDSIPGTVLPEEISEPMTAHRVMTLLLFLFRQIVLGV